jgi:hypothetical protein
MLATKFLAFEQPASQLLRRSRPENISIFSFQALARLS